MTYPRTLEELAKLTGAEIHGDPGLVITGLAPLDKAGAGDLTFFTNPKYRSQLDATRAAAVIVPPGTECGRPTLVSKNPYADFARILAVYAPPIPVPPPGVHPSASVDPSAKLGRDVAIGPCCVVGAGAVIGDRTALVAQVFVGEGAALGADCLLYPCVVLRERVTLGSRVILHSGVVIGADGFGFAPDGETHVKIPQVGTVILEDDVEIGANTTVDRAALGATRIGHGTKIDNHVMIAHNVTVGPNSIIVAFAGISGSTQIGEHVTIAGQVGTVGHIKIGDRSVIGAQSGVMNDVPPGVFYSGYPARSHIDDMRSLSEIVRLPRLAKQVRDLEKRLKELESR